MNKTVRRTAATVGALAILLVACSDTDGDGDLEVDPVAAAQERVDRAEGALADANDAFDEASATFCEDSAQYIESLDRYAGLFTDAEATVGDVTTAGADLDRPQEDVQGSAEDVQAARDDVAAAEQELADAQVALAEAQTGTTAPPDDATTTTTAPLVPEATVARVEQAQTDLDAVFEGVDASTPLTEATQEVNAAAVALQVAWLQLYASAGCLTDEQQQDAVTAVGGFTRALQTSLTTAGYFEGEIDGVYGPATVAAVEALQEASGLPVTGLVDRATADALEAAVIAAGGDAATAAVAHTAALQTVLTVTGHWTGPIDGEWSDALTAALQAFQTDLGVEPTGVVDAATIAAAQQALEDARTPDTTTTTEAEENEETTTTTEP